MKSKVEEFRKLSYQDLQKRCEEIEHDLYSARAKGAAQAENPIKNLKQLKNDLSVAKTIANEKKYDDVIERKNG